MQFDEEIGALALKLNSLTHQGQLEWSKKEAEASAGDPRMRAYLTTYEGLSVEVSQVRVENAANWIGGPPEIGSNFLPRLRIELPEANESMSAAGLREINDLFDTIVLKNSALTSKLYSLVSASS